eukprot:3054121-Amphidinium_carterae.1
MEPLRQQARLSGTQEISSDEDKGLLQLIRAEQKDEQLPEHPAASSEAPPLITGQASPPDIEHMATPEKREILLHAAEESQHGEHPPETSGGQEEVLHSLAAQQPPTPESELQLKEVLQPLSAARVEETFEEKPAEAMEAQEQQPIAAASLAPAHPRPKWAIRQAEHSEEPAREAPPPDMTTETKVPEAHGEAI